MSTAIQHYDGMDTQITQYRDPEQVLAEAQKAATALTNVISMKKDPVKFNGEIYLEREDWGTVARFYNCTAKTVETRYVNYGDVQGFEAVAVVVDIRNGVELGRAESMCLNDEDNWGQVPQYEWRDILDENGKKIWIEKNGKKFPKAEKVQIGTKAKPLFQLRSMAQTRAEAKALRGVFSWVVVLAGYKPTPAEEMTGHEFDNRQPPPEDKPPIQNPQAKTQPTTQDYKGIIEQVKLANSGALWLTVKGLGLVKVEENKIDGDMKPNTFIQFHGRKDHDQRLGGDFYILISLRELSPVQDGEAPAENKLSPEAQKVAEEMFPDPAGKTAVQGMVDNGTLKPASEVGDSKTIGPKRERRLYALMNQSKDRNGGMTEKDIKNILSILPKPVEHLRDLETGMHEQFERWVTGEDDWKAWLESD